jgi:hypothetical protein
MPALGNPLLSNLAVRRDELDEDEQAILERCLQELEALSGRLDDCDRAMGRADDQGGPLLEPEAELPRPNALIPPVDLDPVVIDRCVVR